MNHHLDYVEYAAMARKVAAEGCILLKNENKALPVLAGETVSVFGRVQVETYYCGTGSGGMVNAPYIVSAIDGIRSQCRINEELANTYKSWIEAHPFVAAGWAREPWSQEEMPLEPEVAQAAAAKSDLAVVLIGRTAGEDQDSGAEKGSYYLTDLEEQMLRNVRAAFSRMVVLMNIGGTMDMSWVAEFKPDAVMTVWHGGCESGNAIADVITGKVNPCGRLSDTIAWKLSDYPAHDNFGDHDANHYKEDIYLGYRYFETFAPEAVQYPFGYGLSYTEFSEEVTSFETCEDHAKLTVKVTNTGDRAGKQVVQLYLGAPQGKLGKPSRVLLNFAKTGLLEPGQSQELTFEICRSELASYDDSGKTGHAYAWVVEEGDYVLYAGKDVRRAEKAGVWTQKELTVVEQLCQAMAPTADFDRLIPGTAENGVYTKASEPVPTRQYDLQERMRWTEPELVQEKPETPYMWDDVRTGKVTIRQFLNQMDTEDIVPMTRGEGMFSPLVTGGTAAALGGVSSKLRSYGVPAYCCADGPSGIRMDCGTMAFSIPGGTCIASTFDRELVTEMYSYLALELVKNQISTLLGPGLNLHRYPLCGRNFEYFSEDPLLTGTIAVAVLKGLHTQNITGTIKHFVANNQEYNRFGVDSRVSERALRELYLKAFEICVKQGHARSIMTSYNPVNGIWTACNYDLLTTILRGQWGYQGMVMTDWWANMNGDDGKSCCNNTAGMLRAQNDSYMVVISPETNSSGDNTLEALADGRLTRAQVIRSAENICRVILQANTSMDPDAWKKIELVNVPDFSYDALEESSYTLENDPVELEKPDRSKRGTRVQYRLTCVQGGTYAMQFKMHCDQPDLAQEPVSFFRKGAIIRMVMMKGTCSVDDQITFHAEAGETVPLEMYFGGGGSRVDSLHVVRIGD